MSEELQAKSEETMATAKETENSTSNPVEHNSTEKTAEQMAEEMASAEQNGILQEKEKKLLSKGVEDANFPDLAKEDQLENDQYRRELDFILDIPLDISVELGRTKLLINELLQLGQGSVIELNKLAGELLEIYVNGKLLARGEAVVVNEKFGVRLTDIISPIERVRQLT